MKSSYLKSTVAALIILGIILLYPCLRALKNLDDRSFSGLTMGTLYNVQIVGAGIQETELRGLRSEVENLLRRINGQMSTYDPESEISRFSATTQTTPFPVSKEFAHVAAFALDVAAKSDGAFDPTVAPLVEVWGFGSKGSVTSAPPAEVIRKHKEQVGYRHLSVPSDASLRKSAPDIRLDLNAVAKGYAVDQVAELLKSKGYSNLLVEIGGEITALGHNKKRSPWRISIETPMPGAGVGEGQYKIVLLADRAIATSGDYRNYFEEQGKIYCHIIDPRTGWPVSNRVAGVSVIAHDCMTADAWATALTVLGPTEGLKCVEGLDGIEALLILRNDDGTYGDVMSPGFKRYIEDR